MKLIPKDAKGFERFVYLFAPVFCAALILFMVLSAFQVFNNFYSQACKEAGPVWKVLGSLCLAYTGYRFYKLASDKKEAGKSTNVTLLLLLILTFLLFCGFAYPYWVG